MAKLGDFLGCFPAQDVHDVAGAKADAAVLLNAVNGGEELARGIGAVPNVGWR